MLNSTNAALKSLTTLGFAAASGLATAHDALWVIADDGLHLHQLGLDGGTIACHMLFTGRTALPDEPKARKKAKPDLEALCALPDGRLLALGSGSRRQRMLGSVFEPETASTRVIDLAPLYTLLETELPELNIEGAAVCGGSLMLAHRGNSAGTADALVLLHLATVLSGIAEGALSPEARRGIIAVQLGKLDDAQLTLTDLALGGDGQLWFSAAAEATEDRYDDGACAGSVIGHFNANLKSTQQWRMPGRHKIEGLACIGNGQWLLVADADDPGVRSPLLSLTLTQNQP